MAEASRKRRRYGPPIYLSDVRELVRSLMFVAGLAALVMGDIWLGGHI